MCFMSFLLWDLLHSLKLFQLITLVRCYKLLSYFFDDSIFLFFIFFFWGGGEGEGIFQQKADVHFLKLLEVEIPKLFCWKTFDLIKQSL